LSIKPLTVLPTGHISTTLAYYAVFVAFGTAGAALGATLPNLADNTQSQLSEISVVFTAFALGRLLGVSLSGRFYDQMRGHPVMALMLVLLAATMALVPLMPLLWLLSIVLLLVGVAEGALDVGGNTLLVWVHRDKVGPYMNGLHFAFGLGAFIAPIIIAQIVLLTGSITWAYGVLALLAVPVIFWVLSLPSPEVPIIMEGEHDERNNRLLVVLLVLFFFIFVGAEVAFSGWIFTYATTLNLTDAVAGRYLTSAFFGSFMLGRLLAIPIAARFRPRTILFGDLIGCVVSLGVILAWSTSVTALWIGTLGLGLAMASLFPMTLTLAERRMPITGRITGWFLVGASVGAMFLPWLIGQLFESIGPTVTMVTILIDVILSLGVLVVLLATFNRPLKTAK
jgi:FHS family Na+ dependent glucose MFS transporter 1